ncbi:PQQ-binding-like beta-propeller repeat protein [Aeoliella mucimassa]|nr:PQQ-binding-like beta-propeller repeat protein [Aeoliella mucimassa]
MRVLIALLLVIGISLSTALHATDWPQWQGPNRDAESTESGLLQEWPEGGPALAWRVDNLGGGDSAPSIVDGCLYGMSNRDGQEIVWALSEADGKELWTSSIGPAVEQRMPQSKEGPGGTPTVDGDHLYVVGMGGTIACLERDGGKVVWKRSMTEDFGGIVPPWSYRESPLVDGEKVLCTPGATDAMVVALNKQSGETIWTTKMPAEEPKPEQPAEEEGGRRRGRGGFGRGPSSGAAYSSPIAIEVDGERQYVQFVAKSVLGVSADDGKLLWEYAKPANSNRINCSTPLYKDGLVFAASAYGNGGGAVKLSKNDDGTFTADEVYFTNKMQNHHGGMIVVDGCLYGANGGNGGGFMACLDFQTGDVHWRERDAPKGSLAYADGRLYLRTENGKVMLIEPSSEELLIRGEFEQPDRADAPAWAHPVIANGKLYIRDQGLLLCYDIKASGA